MKPVLNDATTALLRAMSANIGTICLLVEEVRSRSWASATFSGARHELGLCLTGAGARAAADLFAASLDTREFDLRGHILADIALVASEPVENGVRLRLEALTVEDC